MNTETNKFNIIGEQVYEDLKNLVWHMALIADNPNNPMMQADEIVGELSEEMVKGIIAYQNRPYDEMVKIIKCMMGYRMSELRYRHYLTHRKASKDNISMELDNPDNGERYGRPSNIEDIVEFRDTLTRVKAKLDPLALVVLNHLLNYNKDLVEVLDKHGVTSRDKIKPEHMAEALGISVMDARNCFAAIMVAYKEESNE